MNSTPGKPWGPDNPHPLSKMKTELVWEVKYDEYGNRREVDVAGSTMPLQRIETVDQPRSEAAAKGETYGLEFDQTTTRLSDFRIRSTYPNPFNAAVRIVVGVPAEYISLTGFLPAPEWRLLPIMIQSWKQ